MVLTLALFSYVWLSQPASPETSSSSSSSSTSNSSISVAASTASSGTGNGTAFLTNDSLGYIGCSNTQGSVQGYHNVPNEGHFWQPYGTGGFGITAWAKPNTNAWMAFKLMLKMNGQPKAVWIELCEQAVSPVNFTSVKDELSILRQYTTPSTVFYISPLNLYAPGILCHATGPNGVNDTIGFVNEAVAEGLALRGPVLGPLTTSMLVSDMCHPNQQGQQLVGNQLAAFFG